MLEGAEAQHQEIDYLFISTHSNQLHADCIQPGFSQMATASYDANLDESYSVDGLTGRQTSRRDRTGSAGNIQTH